MEKKKIKESEFSPMLMPTFTMASKFGLLKASKSTADILVVLLPRRSYFKRNLGDCEKRANERKRMGQSEQRTVL